MSGTEKFHVRITVNGSPRVQTRPGPTAEDAAERVRREFAKHPHWGTLEIIGVDPR